MIPTHTDGKSLLNEVVALCYNILVSSSPIRYLYVDDSLGEEATETRAAKPSGEPMGSKTTAGFESGALKLQLAKITDTLPRPGYIIYALSKWWKVGPVSPTRSKDNPIQFTVQLTRLYNPIITELLTTDGDLKSYTGTTSGAITAIDASASNTRAGATVAYSATGLPASVTINASTGEITGTPGATGTYTPTVTVTDIISGEDPEDNRITEQQFEMVIS